ncbi:MAG: excisionase family DNA-binding protein [Planctomycetota bacterium]
MSPPPAAARAPGSVRELLSPKQIAAAAGVSESTVKRLVDDGALRAERTAGGHRRIRLSDALAWVRSRGSGSLQPEALAPAVPALKRVAGVDLSNRKAVLKRYSAALEAGDEAVTTGLAMASFVAGAELPEVLEEPIYGRFVDLRSRCNHPSRECTTLHRALANSIVAAGRLRDLACEGDGSSKKAKPKLGVALADVGYEVDSLPVHLAATVAAAAGYEVTNLGARVPATVLAGTVDRLSPKYLWLSANGGEQADQAEVAAAFKTVAATCRSAGVALLVHGDAVPAPDADVYQGAETHRIESFAELARLFG